MFDKAVQRKIGPSFPFIENRDGEVKLKYDAMKIEQDGGQKTITYYQGDVPLYAWTFNAGPEDPVTMTGMNGEIDVVFGEK